MTDAQLAARVLEQARVIARRDDTALTDDQADEYLRAGAWSCDTYWDLVERHAAAAPDVSAIVDESGAVTTWSQLRDRSVAFAAALLDAGYLPGDCLGVQLPNWSEFCVAVLGAVRAGVTPVFIHPPYRAYEMEYILRLTDARGIVVPGRYRGTDYVALARQVQASLPQLRDVFPVRAAGDGSFEALLASHRGRDADVPAPLATDLFVLMFTSGTTSRPKGVMHLHANLLNACRKYVEDFRLGPEDRWLIVTPFTHLTAFGIPFLTGALTARSSVVLLESWDAAKALALVEQHRVTHLVGAPPMLLDIARSPDLHARDLSSLRFLMYAGAPCPVDALRRLQARLGCALAAFYGWTEGLAHTYTLPADPVEVTSTTVGRTGRGWEWRIVDDDGRDVPAGQRGEFWGRGANFSPGYYRQPQFVAQRFRPDGWFMSGDIMTRNADDTFTYVARTDDMINRGGQKLDPREVEELLYQHPKVHHVAVVAVPDARLGQKGCACVVPAEGVTLTLGEIQAFLAEKGLAKYKWPESLELLDQLPLTPTGKTMRYALRERLAAGTAVGR
jgi:non-ribosomal peptide synthetase component E (peptide arylation enzyme)